MLTDPVSLLSQLGALGVFLVMFAETGLLIGFFLPGDSLLFTAGILAASRTDFSLPLVICAAALGAILGAQVGFVLGRRGGTALLRHNGNRHIHSGVHRTTELLADYGHGKAIVLARFIPVVRTVLNPLIGLGTVRARVFLCWQLIGGVLWTAGVSLAGYFLGDAIPNVDQYLLPIIAVIVVISLLPIGIELLSARKRTS